MGTAVSFTVYAVISLTTTELGDLEVLAFL